eukprot:6265666-Amphidinium_carterae.1
MEVDQRTSSKLPGVWHKHFSSCVRMPRMAHTFLSYVDDSSWYHCLAGETTRYLSSSTEATASQAESCSNST